MIPILVHHVIATIHPYGQEKTKPNIYMCHIIYTRCMRNDKISIDFHLSIINITNEKNVHIIKFGINFYTVWVTSHNKIYSTT